MEPNHAKEANEPFDLNDSRQERFVKNPDDTRFRRIKGPAGSGKTVALVRRAAKLAAEGKTVLFVYYNGALTNYLKLACQRAGVSDEQIEWRTFHSFCGLAANQLTIAIAYDELIRGRRDCWDEAIPALLLDRIEQRPGGIRKKYDAIIVDEGQDFNLSWWTLLRKFLADNGEMVLAADIAQDIYARGANWTESAMTNAGFLGRWARLELKGSRRLPSKLIRKLHLFANQYSENILPSLPEIQEGSESPCELRWHNVRPALQVETCVQELWRMIQRDRTCSRAVSDLVLLCDRTSDCISAHKLLSAQGVKVTSSVSELDENNEVCSDRQDLKRRFSLSRPSVKICTFHSFKGWQSRLIVLSVSMFRRNKDEALLYTMMTRLKSDAEGSNLTVVCSVPELAPFGREFEN